MVAERGRTARTRCHADFLRGPVLVSLASCLTRSVTVLTCSAATTRPLAVTVTGRLPSLPVAAQCRRRLAGMPHFSAICESGTGFAVAFLAAGFFASAAFFVGMVGPLGG